MILAFKYCLLRNWKILFWKHDVCSFVCLISCEHMWNFKVIENRYKKSYQAKMLHKTEIVLIPVRFEHCRLEQITKETTERLLGRMHHRWMRFSQCLSMWTLITLATRFKSNLWITHTPEGKRENHSVGLHPLGELNLIQQWCTEMKLHHAIIQEV